jgi:hypothetical protein
MLARILSLIEAAGRPMCLTDIARALDVDESALEGMLGTLEARGRLRAIRGPEGVADACGGCPVRSGCFIMADGVAATWALTEASRLALAQQRAA